MVGVAQLSAALPVAACVTVTVTFSLAEPPVPVQVRVYVVDAWRAAVDDEPLVPRVPDQPPDAVQEVALVEDQVSVDLPPLATLVGLALNVMLGAGVDTDTVVA